VDQKVEPAPSEMKHEQEEENGQDDEEPVTRVAEIESDEPVRVSVKPRSPPPPPPPPPKKRFTARKAVATVLLEVEVDGQVKSLSFSSGANATEVADNFCRSHNMEGADCVFAVEDLIKANVGIDRGAGATQLMA